MKKHRNNQRLEIFLWWMKDEICADITIDESIRFIFLVNSAAQQGVWIFFFSWVEFFENKHPLAQHVQRLHLRYL